MINIEIDSESSKCVADSLPDTALWDAKQLAGMLYRDDYLHKVVIAAVVWATLMSRSLVYEDEDRANDTAEIAIEEHEQLADILTDSVYM